MKTRDVQRRLAAYVQLPHRIAEDPKYAGIYGDDHRLAAFVRLLWAADRSFPAHPSLPRAVDQATVDALAAVGLIALEVNDAYSVPDVDALRTRLAEAARLAGLASGECRRDPTEGERAVPDPGNAPFPSSATGRRTEGGTEREPTKTKTKTKTKTNVGTRVVGVTTPTAPRVNLSAPPALDRTNDEERESDSDEEPETEARKEPARRAVSWCSDPIAHRLAHRVVDGRFSCQICASSLQVSV